MVGIKVYLYEHSTQGLKEGRIGAPCSHVLAGKRYLKQYEENHDGNKNGIDYPGSKVSDGNALAVLLLQDREHQYPVSCVANDGQQPGKRGYCYQHDFCGRSVYIHFFSHGPSLSPGGRVAIPDLEGGQVAVLRLQRGRQLSLIV